MSAQIIPFAAKPERASIAAPAVSPPEPGSTVGFRSLHSNAVFALPFVTLPAVECADWRAFWRETEMWNDEPTDKPSDDFARGRRYAGLAIEALRRDETSPRQLEMIVERMIERAFRRRGPAGKLCRQLPSSEQGFILEVCRAAVKGVQQ